LWVRYKREVVIKKTEIIKLENEIGLVFISLSTGKGK
jgi:hypothetical protein